MLYEKSNKVCTTIVIDSSFHVFLTKSTYYFLNIISNKSFLYTPNISIKFRKLKSLDYMINKFNS